MLPPCVTIFQGRGAGRGDGRERDYSAAVLIPTRTALKLSRHLVRDPVDESLCTLTTRSVEFQLG